MASLHFQQEYMRYTYISRSRQRTQINKYYKQPNEDSTMGPQDAGILIAEASNNGF